MRKLIKACLTATLLFSGFVGAASKPQNLLDENLSQFKNIYTYGTARYENGELVLQSTKNWFFTTKKKYKDFILTAEIKMPDVKEYSNSGIMFRGKPKKNKHGFEAMGYQAEVDPSKRKWSGGLYDQGRRKWLHPLHEKRSFPDSDFKKNFLLEWTGGMANSYKHLEWNQYRIECRGSELKIFVNGVLTTHVIDDKESEGFFGFQHHGSKKLIKTGTSDNIVRFRNIYVTEL
ncbi:DUF1080 domain-containing protein [Catenovulum maritimum]|uniref:Glycosyl hydrolase n=1 Tax=Catenovulum maritimum TaxID=1513271 RepID=A0A0J8GVZ0_9ALTE|nr:DUF1080 domain-containing protein [Catenovulum maritimum]KMT64838.1 glycosyl hydrolase [Catenovulum maritimum]